MTGRVGVEALAEERYWRGVAGVADGLRYLLLGRLLLGPVSLHRLYLDLLEAAGAGLLPGYPTLVEVVDEVRLFEELGLVVRGGSGLLYLDASRLPLEAAGRVEEAAERLAGVLGLEAAGAGGQEQGVVGEGLAV